MLTLCHPAASNTAVENKKLSHHRDVLHIQQHLFTPGIMLHILTINSTKHTDPK